ncbi:hypothetical protein SLS62_009290 [Diatrype stigma]|uniref:Flavin-binding monooxygenase n=1 Tax=Diatrype stigma TaxID=117547 RepID=A0AAN9YJ81_9PEZI
MCLPEQKLHDAGTLELAIIGAGISGINCAYRIKNQLPDTSFAIFDGRGDIGGTWDLFKYPGVRSDSDIYSYAFSWHPWQHPRRYAEGSQIMAYLHDAVSKHGIGRHIRLRHKLLSADWSSSKQRWVLSVSHEGQHERFTARFLVLGTGYYDYQSPLGAEIPGLDDFQGKVVHPQFWPADFNYAHQKVAIIGSGATAVSLLPSMAQDAAQVTMIQRSPTYVLASPNAHHRLRRWLPRSRLTARCELAYYAMKLYLFVLACALFPRLAKGAFRRRAVALLPRSVGYDPHFNPRYYPWEQRVCLDPDGAFFRALHRPNARVVTGQIETVTGHGIRMQGSSTATTIEADVIVTATGLRMKLGADIDVRVDGAPLAWEKRFVWNGAMLEGLPNLAFVLGYTNGSWTVGADATALVLVRLLSYMRRRCRRDGGGGARVAVPRVPRDVAAMGTERLWRLGSTYVRRVEGEFPVYGKKGPWRPRIHPPLDWLHARWGDVTSGLEFS